MEGITGIKKHKKGKKMIDRTKYREKDIKRIHWNQDMFREFWAGEENYMKKDWENETKRCLRCKETLSIKCFSKHRKCKDGLRNICKVCDKKKKREDGAWRGDKGRKKRLKRYGLTIESYDDLREKQKNKCLICGKECGTKKGINGLVVDHDHRTGKVRGLLCSECNKTLGYFERIKKEGLQEKIEDYLRKT